MDRERIQTEAEKALARNYLSAFREAEKKIADLYAKIGPEMSLVDARVKGLASVLKSIDKEYKKLTGQSVDFTIDVASTAYKNSYEVVTAQVPTASWGVLSKDTILESVLNKNSTYNLIKTFRKNLPIELQAINDAITSGIASGRGYVNTAKLIQGAFERGFNDALRVVRTEEGRNWTEGALKAHERAVELGIPTRKVWLSAIDERTRPEHLALDGKEADEDGFFTVPVTGEKTQGPGLFGIAELDINCRCSLVVELVTD